MKTRPLLILFALLLLGACSSPTPTSGPATQAAPTLPPPHLATATPFAPNPTATEGSAPTATTAPSPSPTVPLPSGSYGPDNFPANINPLTGLPVRDPALLERRPIAVKVTLIPRSARPQWGLSFADLVFEFHQNATISRFHAIFYGNDVEKIGPIRSARLFDSALMRMYRSIFAFGSADPTVLSIVEARVAGAGLAPYLVSEYPAGCGPMCRVVPGTLSHLVTNTKDLSQYIRDQGLDNSRQNLNGMTFNVDPPAGGQPASTIFTRFGPVTYSRWDYNRATKRYLRFQDTRNDYGIGEEYAPLVDQLTGKQIAADNVVILLAPQSFYDPAQKIVDITMLGTGPAYAFRDGQVYEVQWSLPTPDQVLTLTFPDGSPYPFKPGNTWFQILGTTSLITQPAADTWRFEYRMP